MNSFFRLSENAPSLPQRDPLQVDLIETEEQPLVTTKARVTEEVHVGKLQEQHTFRATGSVSHTEISVERDETGRH